MRTGAINELQELRRKIYLTAKSEKQKRFWGLFCHVTKMETLEKSYKLVKENKGSPGIDGVTFEEIEVKGVIPFLEEIHEELVNGTYWPQRNRKADIPKGNGKTRTLGIPTIRDRVVQGAVKLILEPIFEADFSEGSYGYRPGRNQHQAVVKVGKGIVRRFTKVIDVDLTAYFDNVNHEILMNKISRRVNDPKIMRLIKLILKAGGKTGVPQGGIISPLLSNIYLNDIDKMFERAKRETARNGYENMEYCRFADDIVILINGHEVIKWLVDKAYRRLKEELAKLKVKLNPEKTKIVDMNKGETFGFLGFDYRLVKNKNRKMVLLKPKKKKVSELIVKVKTLLEKSRDKKVTDVIKELNPILQGWVNYYRIGHCSRKLTYIKNWVESKVRRFARKAQKKFGFGWKEWSSDIIYGKWGLYNDYQVRYYNK
ncbi:MAG: group II intron reverse transcriptase/maturase [Clostridiaceae bacterium]